VGVRCSVLGKMGTKVSTSVNSKIELIPFQTLTLSREQFLRGESTGESAWIAAELMIPRREGKCPAVVLLHGSSGIRENVDYWAKEFVRSGAASFVVDSFSGRGLGGTNSQQWRLSATSMIVDAYHALRVLSEHPRVESTQIILMGFSKGGTAALYASMRRFQQARSPPSQAFAAHVALYPFCGTTFLQEQDVMDVPLLVFHGSEDDVTPVNATRRYVRKLVDAGKNAKLIELEGARHFFDLVGEEKSFVQNVQNMSRCLTEEIAPGIVINPETGRVDGPDDPRIYSGATFGHSSEALALTTHSIEEFCRALFSVNSKRCSEGGR